MLNEVAHRGQDIPCTASKPDTGVQHLSKSA